MTAAYAVTRLHPPLQGFFSQRCLAHCGLPVLAHACVAPQALQEAARRLDRLLARLPACAARLGALGCSVQVIGAAQRCSDLPQYAAHVDEAARAAFDARGRGYGGLCPSCGEENLLRLESDRYGDHRDILTHEASHTVLDWGVPLVQSRALKAALEATRQASLAAGRWTGAYAGSNCDEFFAECAMWHFGSRGDAGRITQPPVTEGRAWLEAHDPDAAALVAAVFAGRFFQEPCALEAVQMLQTIGTAPAAVRSCAAESRDSQLVVHNHTAAALTLSWLPFDPHADPVPYASVPAGGMVGQCTFQGHAWAVSADGTALGTYIAGEGLCRINVSAVSAHCAVEIVDAQGAVQRRRLWQRCLGCCSRRRRAGRDE